MGYVLRHSVWVLFQVFLEFVRVWHIPVDFRQNKHCISRVVLCLHRRFLACARACSLQFLLHSDLAKVVDCLSRHSGVSGSTPERLHIERDWRNENTVNWCLSKFSLVKVRWLKSNVKVRFDFWPGSSRWVLGRILYSPGQTTWRQTATDWSPIQEDLYYCGTLCTTGMGNKYQNYKPPRFCNLLRECSTAFTV